MNATPNTIDESLTADEATQSRRPRRLRKALAAGLATVVLATGTAAFAAPAFDDVPESHPFYEEIQWMNDTGISTGYEDGTFRPGDPVTRQAMSAFMQRLYNLQDTTYATAIDSAKSTSSTTWSQPAGYAVQNIEVPAGTRGWLHASFNAETRCHDGGGYCRARIMYGPQDGGGAWEMFPTSGDEFGFDSTNGDSEGGDSWEAHGFSRSTLAPLLPGTYKVWLEVSVSNPDGTTLNLDDAHFMVNVDLQATDI
jgi:hypothetical protein